MKQLNRQDAESILTMKQWYIYIYDTFKGQLQQQGFYEGPLIML
jgi:hypothetical protein